MAYHALLINSVWQCCSHLHKEYPLCWKWLEKINENAKLIEGNMLSYR